MATIDKNVKFKAGGKEYTVCYPLKAVMGAEQELPGNSLFKAVAVASLTNFYIMLKCGLIGGGTDRFRLCRGRNDWRTDFYSLNESNTAESFITFDYADFYCR